MDFASEILDFNPGPLLSNLVALGKSPSESLFPEQD